jgi:hypothetical protein
MMPRLTLFAAIAIATSGVTSCAREHHRTTTTPASGGVDRSENARPTKARCFDGLASTGAARADYEELARRCGKGQKPITPVFEGVQSAGQKSQRLKFLVADAEQCIQVLAAGSAGVEELDLMLRGLDGQPLVRDEVGGRLSVAPLTALCVRNPGEYEVDVSVTRGRGQFIVGVWASANASSHE